jgi:hypothetical protein
MVSKLTERLFFPIFLLVTVFTNAQVKPMSADARLKSMQQRQVLKSKSVLDSVKFRSIGPSIMSGRVVDVDANPSDPTEFFVAYASGGLW